MAGARDLFSGSRSLTGADLYRVDKNPLDELNGGIDDAIGHLATNVGSAFISGVEALITAVMQAILGEIDQALIGLFGGLDVTLLHNLKGLTAFFDNLRAFIAGAQTIVDGWKIALQNLHLPDPLTLIQQIPGSIAALIRDPEGGLSAIGSGLIRDAEGAITWVEDGLTHLIQQADQGLLSLPQIGEQIVHAATLIAPTLGTGVADVINAGQQANTALVSAIEQAGATVGSDIVAGATQLGNRLVNMSNAGIYDAEQGFNNLANSLLKHLTPTGGSIGQFDAAGLQGAVNTAVTYGGHALSTVLGGIEAATGDFVGTVTGALDSTATFGSHALSTVLGGIEAATGNFVGTLSSAAIFGGHALSTVLGGIDATTGHFIGVLDAAATGALNSAITFGGHALSTVLGGINAATGNFIGVIDSAATGALNTAITFGGHPLSTVLGGINVATGDFVGAVDSAATIAGQVASTVQANAQGALDSIVQAARNDGTLVNQAVADAKAELVYLFSGFAAAFTGGNTTTPPAASAADAVVAAGAIHEHLSIIGNTKSRTLPVQTTSRVTT